MPLDLFDNVFLLDFALKSPQGVLERLSFLETNFSQAFITPFPKKFYLTPHVAQAVVILACRYLASQAVFKLNFQNESE
ncbi:MAG: hypothetical protein ACRD1N_07390 [Terriglobia bacterium]